MALTKTDVSKLYVSIFNRASESEGNTNWQQFETMAEAANLMLVDKAAKEYFGPSLETDVAFVEHIYANTLNKGGADVDAAGKAGWVELLGTGMSRGEMVSLMIEAIEEYQVGGSKYDDADQATKDAAQQFVNRVKVSDYTADTLATITVSEIDSTLSFGGALIVTADPDTVETAEKKIDAANPANIGKTFTLTTDDDTFLGTAKNDKVIGTDKTYNDGDTIVDGSTTDNDVLELTTAKNISVTPKVTNIENINITAAKVGGFTFDADGIFGAKTYNVTRTDTADGAEGTGAVTLDNVSSAKFNAKDKVTDFTVNFAANGNKAGEATINGGTGAVTVSNIGKGGVVVNSAADKAVSLTGTAGSQATVNSSGAVAVSATTVGDLTLNANDVATYTLNAIGDSLTLAGDKDLTLKIAAARIGDEEVINENTAKTVIELTTVVTADLTDVENVDRIVLADTAAAATTLTVNSDQLIATKANQTNALTIENAGTAGKGTAKFATIDNGDEKKAVTAATLNFGATKNFDEVIIDASGSKLDVTVALDVNKSDLVLNGTKDIKFKTVTEAKSITSSSTGNITLTSTGNAAEQDIVLGAGDDKVTINGVTTTFAVSLGDGKNDLTITNAKAGSTFVTGAGNDTVTLTDAAADAGTAKGITINTGAGDDTIKLGALSTLTMANLSIDGGAGSDTLIATVSQDLTGATISNIENISVNASQTLTLSAKQFKDLGSFKLGGAGTLKVSTAADNATIDGKQISMDFGSEAVIDLNALAGVDSTLISSNYADKLTGASGKDTFVFDSNSGNTSTIIDSITGFSTTNDKIKTGTAGTATNFTDSSGGAGVANAGAIASANSAFAAMTGTTGTKYFVQKITDTGIFAASANDFALFIDWNGDNVADQAILVGTSTIVATDIIA